MMEEIKDIWAGIIASLRILIPAGIVVGALEWKINADLGNTSAAQIGVFTTIGYILLGATVASFVGYVVVRRERRSWNRNAKR